MPKASLVGFFAVTWVLGVLWAFATPLMQSPDEWSHVRKAAAVVRGQLTGHGTVRVPESIARIERPCWVYRQPCHGPPAGWADVTVEAVSYHSQSQPTYYTAVGWITLVAPGTWSVYAMRIVSALLFAALVTLAAHAALSHPRPRWMLVGLAAAMTPMALFLGGSVNPNGLEIAAGAALWLTLLAWLAFPVRAKGAGLAALVAGLTLVGLRPLSVLWAALIVVAVWALRTQPIRAVATRRAALGVAAVGALAGASAAWTVFSGTLNELVGSATPRYHNLGAVFWDTLLSLGTYLQQMVGVFGWGDNLVPFHVFLAWFSVIAILVIPAFALSDRPGRLVLGGLLISTALFPIVLQLHHAAEKGLIWQGRYLLPLAVGIPIVAGLLLARSPPWEQVCGTMAAVALGLLGVAQVAAFWWALHGNVAGRSAPWLDFNPRWQPPGGWFEITLAYTVLIGLWLGLFHRMANTPQDTAQPLAEAAASATSPAQTAAETG